MLSLNTYLRDSKMNSEPPVRVDLAFQSDALLTELT